MAPSNRLPEPVDYKDIQDTIDKYTKDFPAHRPSTRLPASEIWGDVILLTGSTGHFGSAVLAQLVLRTHVKKIYAFNRPHKGGKTLKQRHLEAFLDHGQDIALLNSPKLSFVEGDTSRPDLGITNELYAEIRDSISHIIHNAWRVHFGSTFRSFEPLIRGLRNLVDLALLSPHRSPPRLLFTSSVTIFSAPDVSHPIPEGPADIRTVSVTVGYVASKFVCENVLEIASQRTPLRPIIVRVCQLTGFENGSWGVHEWIPRLMLTAEIVGCLPNNTSNVSWMPTVPAAVALIQMLSSPYIYLHLAHPRMIPFSTIVRYAAEAFKVPVVSYSEWISKLERIVEDPNFDIGVVAQKQSLGLLPLFQFLNENSLDEVDVETRRAHEVASALNEEHLPPLGKTDASRWVAYWKRVTHPSGLKAKL